MISHGHYNDARKKNDVHVTIQTKSDIAGYEGRWRHQEDADPHAEKPDEADIVRGFALDDPQDERDIEERQDHARNRSNF